MITVQPWFRSLSPRIRGSADGAYLVSARALSALLGIGQLSALARLLTDVQFALVATSVAVAGYLQLVAEPSILGYQRSGSHIRSEDSSPAGPRSIAYLLLIPAGIVIAVVGLIVGALSGSPLVGLGMGVWGVSLVQLRWVSVQYLNWGMRRSYVNTLLVNSVARVLTVILVAWLLRDGGIALLLGGLASMGATALMGPSRPPLVWASAAMRALLVVGIPMALVSAAITGLTSWPVIAGSLYLPTGEFAMFAAQTGIVTSAFGVTTGLVIVFGFPEAKRLWDKGDTRAGAAVVPRYLWIIAGLTVVLGAFFWVFGDQVTALLLGGKYAGHVLPTVWIGVLALDAMTTIVAWILQLKYQQNSLAVTRIAFAFLQVPAVALGAAHFALPGLVTGVALINLIQLATLVFLATRGSGMPTDVGFRSDV